MYTLNILVTLHVYILLSKRPISYILPSLPTNTLNPQPLNSCWPYFSVNGQNRSNQTGTASSFQHQIYQSLYLPMCHEGWTGYSYQRPSSTGAHALLFCWVLRFWNYLSPGSSLLGHNPAATTPFLPSFSQQNFCVVCLCWLSLPPFFTFLFQYTPTWLPVPPLPLRLILSRSPVISMLPKPMGTSSLIKLHLSAAFDTADHLLLLERLSFLSFCGIILSWISYPLTGCFSYSSFLAPFLAHPILNTLVCPSAWCWVPSSSLSPSSSGYLSKFQAFNTVHEQTVSKFISLSQSSLPEL